MSEEEKPMPPILGQESTMNYSLRDIKKLTSRVWHQDELLNKKRRWLVGLPAVSMLDGSKKKSKRPKFLSDEYAPESCFRSNEVSYEKVRSNVEKSFGSFNAFSGSQGKHHVVENYLKFFETFNTESYHDNPSYFLHNLYSMMNVLNNNALCLIATLVTDKKIRFEKTRSRMKKVIKNYLPKVLEGSSDKDCLTPIKELFEVFKDPGNFQKKQLMLLTPVSASLMSSILKALEEIDQMPFEDLKAMNKKLRGVTFVPQFPPPRSGYKRDLLLERVKKRCKKFMLNLKEGDELPELFAKALSVVQLSLKRRTRCLEITESKFYPFSPETVGLQNDILGAIWSLPKVGIYELIALQPLVDPKAKVAQKVFRINLRKYLMEYLFYCDAIDIPDEVSRILATLNRKSRRRLQLFSTGIVDEEVEAVLNISCHLKATASHLLPDKRIDENPETLGTDDDCESNDFDLADECYCANSNRKDHGSCLNDEAEGTVDSNFISLKSDMQFIKKLPILNQDNHINPLKHCFEQASIVGDFIKKSNLESNNRNEDLIKRSNPDPGNHKKTCDHCPEEELGAANMREILIQDISDEISLVAYRLIGHVLDNFLLAEGGDSNEIARCYLRGGSPLDSSGIEDSLNGSKEETGTEVLIQSVKELLPDMPKRSIERVKKLMELT
ncbi:uncharacterized protein LOC109824784 isoform X2 [Asparagus officinalis]|uniref:uncharacterized protein LOC109824784 isoform X2 n=1 Tax=Asparagus officinalis TaxID=4686 RepID=UPI00098E5480|nr:uncharacterized protein LOC109824784 isoform X2 [Asparagus officinalis]